MAGHRDSSKDERETGFIELIPRGAVCNPWPPLGHEKPLEANDFAEECDVCKIEDARKQLLKQAFLPCLEPREIQGALVCKPRFVTEKLPEVPVDNVLLDILCDRATLFSRSYIGYTHNHGAHRLIAADYPRNADEKHRVFVEQTIAELQGTITDEAVRAACEKALREVDAYGRKIHRPFRSLYDQLIAALDTKGLENCRDDAVKAVFEQWQITLPLQDAEALRLYMGVYMRKFELAESAIKAAGHFKAEYTKADVEEFREYKKRKSFLGKVLLEARQKCRELSSPFDNLDQSRTRASISNKTVRGIRLELQAYFRVMGTEVRRLDDGRIAEVLARALVQADSAAFRFLVLCVWGRGAIFSPLPSTAARFEEYNFDFKQRCYLKEKPVAKQRMAFLRLMVAVCGRLAMERETVQVNLMQFLRFCGCAIRSKEEERWWEETLQAYDLMQEPVGIALRWHQELEQCFSVGERDLFCYEGGSPLHLGGFVDFYNRFESSIRNGRNYRQEDVEALEKFYLAEWGSPNPDIAAIRQKCREASVWMEETEQMNKWICKRDACIDTGKYGSRRHIDRNELRALRMECYIQSKHIEAAKRVLQDKIDLLLANEGRRLF